MEDDKTAGDDDEDCDDNKEDGKTSNDEYECADDVDDGKLFKLCQVFKPFLQRKMAGPDWRGSGGMLTHIETSWAEQSHTQFSSEFSPYFPLRTH